MTQPPAPIFDAKWLMEQAFPPIQYVVPGIIPEGMTLLVAAPKIGKSWLVLGLALEISTGGSAFGAIPTGDPRPVLYLALEDGPRRLQSRIRTLKPASTSPLLQFLTAVREGQVVEIIATFLNQHAGQDPVVILDTLGKVMPNGSSTKTQYAADYDFLGALKGTCDAVPGSSLVIVHHTRKMGGDDFLDAVSGTQGIAGSADTVLVLRRDRQEQQATLHVTSRDAAEGEYAMSLGKDGAWTLVGGSVAEAAQAAQTAKQTAGVGDRMADVVTAVARHANGIRAKDVAALLSLDEGTAGRYLLRAFEAGRVSRIRRGLYTPVGSVGSVLFDGSGKPKRDTKDTSDTGSKGVGNVIQLPTRGGDAS